MLNKSFRYLVRKARSPLKAIKILIKRQLGWLGVPRIVPYTAYGNREKVHITGAVIEDKGLAQPVEGQKLWKNILAMVKRYSGDEIAGVNVKIEYNGKEEIVQTDEQGLFHTILPAGRHEFRETDPAFVHYTLIDEVVEGQGTVTAKSKIHFNDRNTEFLVISDIDDTILVSHSTRLLKKLRLMLFKNALTRSAFEGVAAFYRALCSDRDKMKRSIFYVSSSEWNLYDLLQDFLAFKGIPDGPLLLSNDKLKIFSLARSGRRHEEKIDRILALFELYHDQDFILIGDSGQRDPEIYMKVASMFPSRVKTIYIRYAGSKKRAGRLEKIVRDAEELGTEMIPVRTTIEAAEHAAARGYIHKNKIPGIKSEKIREEQLPD